MASVPSASWLLTAYASVSTTVMLLRSAFHDLLPQAVRDHLCSALLYFVGRPSDQLLTLAIEDDNGMTCNEIFDAAEIYLATKVSTDTDRLRVSKVPNEHNLVLRLQEGERISDLYDGVQLTWTFGSAPAPSSEGNPRSSQQPSDGAMRECFELSFDKRHREKVLGSYLPFVVERSKEVRQREKGVKLHTLRSPYKWQSINMEHPATFDTVAMDPAQKKGLIEDLDRFVRRKEFYRRVGRAWKRGYLLYGPPGTGKSSLVAAMANHLTFDIYDLQLASITSDSDLRKILLSTTNRSILVIEDIDCSVELPDRQVAQPPERKAFDLQVTLSGLLNFVDGLWSSCGDERIIVFTTNHKEKLDPALLRPGRMDLHVHMSYCTPEAFTLLATNYLGTSATRGPLFRQIQLLMKSMQVTPAQVAEELMKSEDPTIALGEVLNLLKRQGVEGAHKDGAGQKGKRQKTSTQNGACMEPQNHIP